MLFIASATVLASPVLGRQLTVKNNCDYTVWPALFTDLNISQSIPDHPTGWEAKPHTSVSFTVPSDWKAGRLWGRTECDFSSNPGSGSCATGGCNGGLLCDTTSGVPIAPATTAEFTFQGNGLQDFFDVSLVDGFNIPVEITNTKRCPVATCPVDLNANCPSQLQVKDASGNIVGCKSACAANLDGHPENSPNCCTGSHSTPAACPPTGVAFYDYFKSRCPKTYVYSYDESGSSPQWVCDSGSGADYTVTFCP
jgi:hypothetical protein